MSSGPFHPPAPSDVTVATVNLFVDLTGNDANPGTSLLPCRTIQGALAKVPKKIRHPVTIAVGQGSFTGAWVGGFSVLPPDEPTVNHSWLSIEGTMSAFAVSQGANTGVATGFTAASGATFGFVDDSTQNWAVDELVGQFLEVTGGTGFPGTLSSPPFFVIVGNTATRVTCLGLLAGTAAIGSGYRISTTSTIIDTGVVPSATTATPAGTSTIGVGTSGLTFQGSNVGHAFAVRKLQFNLGATNPTGIRYCEAGIRAAIIRMIGAASTVAGISGPTSTTQTPASAGFAGTKLYFNLPSGVGSALTNLTTGAGVAQTSFSLTQMYVQGGLTGVTSSGVYGGTVSQSLFKAQSGSAIALASCLCTQITTSRIDGSAIGVRINENFSSGGISPGTCQLNSVDIGNCTTAAVSLTGSGSSAVIGATGTGNAIGLNITRGARAVVSASTTMTGTTEVSIDGAASTWAAMRALNPKVINNANYFTAFYE